MVKKSDLRTYVVTAKVNGYTQTCAVVADDAEHAAKIGAERLGLTRDRVRARLRDSKGGK